MKPRNLFPEWRRLLASGKSRFARELLQNILRQLKDGAELEPWAREYLTDAITKILCGDAADKALALRRQPGESATPNLERDAAIRLYVWMLREGYSIRLIDWMRENGMPPTKPDGKPRTINAAVDELLASKKFGVMARDTMMDIIEGKPARKRARRRQGK